MKRNSFFVMLAVVGIIAGATSAQAQESGAEQGLTKADSLLQLYENSSLKQKIRIAPSLFEECLKGDEVVSKLPAPTANTPADSVDLLTFFAADRYYYNTAKFKLALEYIDRALALCGDSHDDLKATMLSDRGYLFFKTGNMSEATEAAHKAVAFATKTGNLLQLSRAYIYLSLVNFGMRLPEQSIEFIEKAIATNNKLGLNNNTHNVYGIACEVYSFAEQMDKAVSYGLKAVEAAKSVGSDDGLINHLAQLSYAYNKSGDYERGVESAQKAIDYIEQKGVNDKNLLAISIVYKAHNLLDMKRYHEAADEMRKAIALDEEIGNTRAACSDYKTLHEALQYFDEHAAMQALLRFATMNDSLHNIELHEALANANAEFRNEELKLQNDRTTRISRLIIAIACIIVFILLAAMAVLVYVMKLKSQANKTLREIQRAREVFFTNITHELRTPLTLILGMAQKVRKSLTGTAEQKENVEGLKIIEREGGRLLQLINQILDISKVKANISKPNWRTGNIVAYISMVVESYQHLADSKGIDLIYAPETNQVQADFVPDYIQKIVGNLLSNAIKFTPEYGHVYITTKSDEQNLTLNVADSGGGYKKRTHATHLRTFLPGGPRQHGDGNRRRARTRQTDLRCHRRGDHTSLSDRPRSCLHRHYSIASR